MAAAEGRQAPEPALGRSTVLNREGLDKVLFMVATDSTEWGPTKFSSASIPIAELTATSITLHLFTLFTGLLPPFSDFFNFVLTHYQIHGLHLDTRSFLLLSSFAFLCEAFLGVPPLVALLQHLFTLRLTASDQCSGCVSLQAVEATQGECIDMRINHTAEGFMRQWVYVEAGQHNRLLPTPSPLMVPRSEWGHVRLATQGCHR
ncbi:hypothetical protein D1007_26222 [Hordeum vulgare]|nr:hypothetical protein D1007_26222 [Hordeum vulgare]